MSEVTIATILISAFIVITAAVWVWYFYFKKKKKSAVSSIKVENKPEYVVEKIQLYAIKRLPGSSPTKFETEDEIKSRLATLSKEEFIALNVDDRPWTEKEWSSAESFEEIENRNLHEISMFYAYNPDGSLNKGRSEVLCREFKTFKK